jgi:hypothetical protein
MGILGALPWASWAPSRGCRRFDGHLEPRRPRRPRRPTSPMYNMGALPGVTPLQSPRDQGESARGPAGAGRVAGATGKRGRTSGQLRGGLASRHRAARPPPWPRNDQKIPAQFRAANKSGGGYANRCPVCAASRQMPVFTAIMAPCQPSGAGLMLPKVTRKYTKEQF